MTDRNGGQLWWARPRQVLRRVLALDDSPHCKALGVAIGMFVGLTPTVGLQIVIVLTLAWLTRRLFSFNVSAALVTVYVSNPVTVLPIYWLNYQVGTLFVAGHANRETFDRILRYDGWRAWLAALEALFVEIGLPLVVGSLVVATVAALLTYPLVVWTLGRLSHEAESA
jgi:uncharacterized protein (DUF2062 family)